MSQSKAETLRAWSIPIGIILIAGLLITLIVMQVVGDSGSQSDGGSQQAPTSTETTQAAPDLSFVESRDERDVQAAGPVDAPAVLVIYSDYQCPYCAAWSNDTLPAMMQYAEKGDLRIEWRDVNQFGPESERASLAAHAAGLQGKFWVFHNALFPNGEHLTPEQLTEAALTELAGELGLDTAQFASDMTSEETISTVQRYASEGRQLGVSGTPSFVLAGEPLVGAQPTEVFIATLDRKLAEAAQ